MKFAQLSLFLSDLESTSSRLKITAILADLFKACEADEIAPVCYLCLGELTPSYQGLEFNLAEKMMIRVLAKTTGRQTSSVLKIYQKLGDLGEVVQQLNSETIKLISSGDKDLTVTQVYNRLVEIARESGQNSVERKINKMVALIEDLDNLSVKYLVRIPVGKLRLGFSEKTIIDGLSWMITGDKSLSNEIKGAYNIRADIGEIAKLVKQKQNLNLIKPEVGIPILPSLCQRLPNTEEIIAKMGEVAVEPKFDGTRLQIHFDRSQNLIRLFTRSLENISDMFPDLTKAIPEEVKADNFILDGEAIGFDPKTGKFLPFQEIMQRKRKYEILEMAKQIPLKFFAFDILYFNNQSLIKTPLKDRRQILEKVIRSRNRIQIAEQIILNDPIKLRHYHDEQIKKGLEGVVVKKINSLYVSDRIGFNWVKLKQEKGKKGGGLSDTIDCVIMGYNSGRGKRAGFGVGGFLVGLRKNEEFVTVSKIGTGLTDLQWRELKTRCDLVKSKLKPKEYVVNKNMKPNVWCAPEIVAEIEADNITRSPIHTAGLALRFPRLVRFRDDKMPSQSSTVSELEKLYQMQK